MDKRYSAHERDQEPRDRWTHIQSERSTNRPTVKRSKSRGTSKLREVHVQPPDSCKDPREGEGVGGGDEARCGSVSREPAHHAFMGALFQHSGKGHSCQDAWSQSSFPGPRTSPPAADMSSQRRSEGWARGVVVSGGLGQPCGLPCFLTYPQNNTEPKCLQAGPDLPTPPWGSGQLAGSLPTIQLSCEMTGASCFLSHPRPRHTTAAWVTAPTVSWRGSQGALEDTGAPVQMRTKKK